MLRSLIVTLMVSICNAKYSSLYDTVTNRGAAATAIPAAVNRRYSFDIFPIQIPQRNVETPTIEIGSNLGPIFIRFKSASSKIHLKQTHRPQDIVPVQSTSSVDEPNYVKHQVTRPIIQEVREVVAPYRFVTQEIRPVVQEVNTVIAGKGGSRSVPRKKYIGEFETENSYKAIELPALDSNFGSAYRTNTKIGTNGYSIGYSMLGRPRTGLGGSAVTDVSKLAGQIITGNVSTNNLPYGSKLRDEQQRGGGSAVNSLNNMYANYKMFNKDLYQCVTY